MILYGDFNSQPSRAVWALATQNNLDFKFQEINLSKKEQYGAEFKKLNPISKVPVM